MDLISAFKSELFRPLTTIVVPGGFAVGPWLLAAMERDPELARAAMDVPGASVPVCLAVIIAAGFVLENLGARIEHVWDKRLQRESKKKENQKTHDDKWHEYLQLETKDEIIGQRYLQTIVVRMKFELAFGPALVIGALGMFDYNLASHEWSWLSFWCAFCATLALAAYLIWESWGSANIAESARDDVLAGARAMYLRRQRPEADSGRTGVAAARVQGEAPTRQGQPVEGAPPAG